MPTNKRRPLISGNWKMHLNHFEAIQTVQKLSYVLRTEDYAAAEVSVHPPFTDLRSVQTVIESDRIPIALGAQHCHWEEKGAFTGEVSPPMLAKLNVTYVITGHSERRQHFGETDEDVNRKVKAILKAGMTPIMCCGETLEEREAGTTEERVAGQVRAGLAGVSAEHVAGLVIAYEPIWAIGTGRTATPAQAEEVHQSIRGQLAKLFGSQGASRVRILYGGSVKADNVDDLMAEADIDGALVGGASLDASSFTRICGFQRRK